MVCTLNTRLNLIIPNHTPGPCVAADHPVVLIGIVVKISPEEAKENSPGRKPWENVRPLTPKPPRGARIWANLAASFAPTGAPGKKNRKTFPFS